MKVPASRELRVPSRLFLSPTSRGDLGQGARAKPFLADMILLGRCPHFITGALRSETRHSGALCLRRGELGSLLLAIIPRTWCVGHFSHSKVHTVRY